jgi:ERCC4-type nuclease
MATKATIVADCNPGEDIVVICLNAQGYRSVERKRLPLGDYQITCGDAVVLVERKTLDDWRSSMIDGRLDAQRARAEELFQEAGVKLVYILEGGVADWSEELNYGVKNKALAASILKMSLRDGHHVIQSRMPASTAAAIGYIADQLANGGLKPKPVSVAAGVLGKRPRDVRATLPPLVAPLAAITGVSLETAELLASKFETASKVVAASENEIADIKLKSGRRIGNAVAKRIKACFC